MKISSPEIRVAPTISSPSRIQSGDVRTAEPAVVGITASANVKLSDAAATLVSSSERAPAFDAEKVARIAKAIATGSYTVKASAMADKMIQNTRESLSRAG